MTIPPDQHLTLYAPNSFALPALVTDAGEHAAHRLLQFFTAEIRNPNTRAAYARAVARFDRWCAVHQLTLAALTPIHVAAYVEHLGRERSKPTVKQHLAALRMLFDYLVTGHVVPTNPAAPVRGPKYTLKVGKTPVLDKDEVRQLFAALGGESVADRRDRALIGLLVYSFARITAVLQMDVSDYHQRGKRWWVRLHEKGGKDHAVPVHHSAEEYLDAYLSAAGIADQPHTPLFRTLSRQRTITSNRLDRHEALAMVKRRCRQAGLGEGYGCHTFRATGITAYLSNGGTVEKAQAIAAHESPRTTMLYDRTSEAISLDEIERIVF